MDIEQRTRDTLRAEGERLPMVATQMIPAIPEPTKRRTFAIAVTAFLAVLGLGALANAVLPGSETVDAEPEAATATTEVVWPLQPIDIGEAPLHYPTLLPSDLDLCGEFINPPTVRVIFCNGGSSPDRSLKIEVKGSYLPEPLGYTPLGGAVPDRKGWTTSGDSPTLVTIPVSEAWHLRVEAEGMKLEEIVAIMDSLPIINNREAVSTVAAPETRIKLTDVDDATLRSLVADEEFVKVYNTNGDQALIVIDDATARRTLISVNSAEPFYSGEFALGEPSVLVDAVGLGGYARLVEGVDRPVLIGGIDGETQLTWVQGNLLWSFSVVQDPDLATARAIALMDQIQRILIDGE
jgi:hypothetical protein